jgi:hypothetical protein
MTEESTAVGGRPFIFENVWQVKDLQARFLDVWQIKGVTRRNFVSVAGKGVMGFLRMSEWLVGCRKSYRERRDNHKASHQNLNIMSRFSTDMLSGVDLYPALAKFAHGFFLSDRSAKDYLRRRILFGSG